MGVPDWKHSALAECSDRLSGDQFRQEAQLHGQLGGDFVIAEFIEQFERHGLPAATEQHCALSAFRGRKPLTGIAAIVAMGAAPDMLQSLLARHRPDRMGFPFNDRRAETLGRALV